MDGRASAGHACGREAPRLGLSGQPAGSTAGRSGRSGPCAACQAAQARWQDGSGVGPVAARAVCDGGRALDEGGAAAGRHPKAAYGDVEHSRRQATASGHGARVATWAEPEQLALSLPDRARRATGTVCEGEPDSLMAD
jgi:hypothetical protein